MTEKAATPEWQKKANQCCKQLSPILKAVRDELSAIDVKERGWRHFLRSTCVNYMVPQFKESSRKNTPKADLSHLVAIERVLQKPLKHERANIESAAVDAIAETVEKLKSHVLAEPEDTEAEKTWRKICRRVTTDVLAAEINAAKSRVGLQNSGASPYKAGKTKCRRMTAAAMLAGLCAHIESLAESLMKCANHQEKAAILFEIADAAHMANKIGYVNTMASAPAGWHLPKQILQARQELVSLQQWPFNDTMQDDPIVKLATAAVLSQADVTVEELIGRMQNTAQDELVH